MHEGVSLADIDTTETDPIQCEQFPQADALQVIVSVGGRGLVVNMPDAGVLTIGRSDVCNVRIDDHALSRIHARLRRQGSQVLLSDLRSRNGIRVNGQRVQEAQLDALTTAVLGHTTVSLLSRHDAQRVVPNDMQENTREMMQDRGTSLLSRGLQGTSVRRTPAADAPATTSTTSASHKNVENTTSTPNGRAIGQTMLHLARTIDRVANRRIPVLIQGETGVGKELVAMKLHARSNRAAGPLQVINCAAIPDSLMESAFFGHMKGAFTGADRTRKGVFEQAQGGTVFLDEVGELSLAGQAALLRVLDTGRFTAIGGDREVSLDVRVVAATHRDLDAMAETGAFRLDLLHRLNVVVLPVPPLRERRHELEPLVREFMSQQPPSPNGRTYEITPDALACLRKHDFPGNIRELRNMVARVAAFCETHVISVSDLPPHIQSLNSIRQAGNGQAGDGQASKSFPLVAPAHAMADESQSVGQETLGTDSDLRRALASHERDLIGDALKRCGGHQRRAATLLGLPLRTLERKVHKHGLGGGNGAPSELPFTGSADDMLSAKCRADSNALRQQS